MIKLHTFILMTLFSCLLSGCGQKGALRHAEKNTIEIDQAYQKQHTIKQLPSVEKETNQ